MPSVGKPVPHDSAVAHVTGAAAFIEDFPRQHNELIVGFVGSPVARGQIDALELEAARQVPGVVGVYSWEDVEGENLFGLLYRDEPFLASGPLSYRGQPVVVVAAEDRKALDRGLDEVKILATTHSPVLSIEAAVSGRHFLGPARRICRGDVDRALAWAPCVLEGTFASGGQEQFYFESQAALAYPGEEGQLVVHSSTQNPTQIQAMVAEVLGLGQHQLVVVCKRMGGAFGGKETQAALPAAMAALVAHRTGRAARVIYSKDDDMKVTGKRHPYLTQWRVGFKRDGSIVGLRLQFYSNGGAAADLSTSVMERTLLHAENAYYIPHICIEGQVCFTNLPPNTAFRGFGGPQAVVAMENIVEDIAHHLGLDSYRVRQSNLYGSSAGTGAPEEERHTTPYGQVFHRDHNHLPEILPQLARTSGYHERRQEIEIRNRESATELRGISMTPVKFGISFTTAFLNQGNALVNVYTDGTVQVSTGGTEMGQGLNVKIRQLVADELGLDPAQVAVMATSTEKNNNTSPTAASASTDLNGTAAVLACRKIKRRLTALAAPLLASPEDGLAPSVEHVVLGEGRVYDRRRPGHRLEFAELAQEARRARVDLGARGFYATPGIDFNRETGKGCPFAYFTQGAAVAEVAVDRFTGELRVLRVDVLIDIGPSINPGVDRGQIIGGFVQGMGWVTTEALCYNDAGELLSHSPTTYKIPAITDLPQEFNVELLDVRDNRHNLRGSKGVGEPPLLLGIAPWAAVKHALSGLAPGRQVALGLPATSEEILRCMTSLAPLSAAADSEDRLVPAQASAEPEKERGSNGAAR